MRTFSGSKSGSTMEGSVRAPVPRSPYFQLESPAPRFVESRFAHDFSQIPVHQKLEGGRSLNEGEPLPGPMRAMVESRLGTRVGDVRLHRGLAAERAVSALGAPAFTLGQHVVLGPRAATATPEGEHLLYHEVAHAVQQAAATPPLTGSLARTEVGGREEREAEAAARGLQRPISGAKLAIAAAPPTPLLTLDKRFKEIWPAFEKASVEINPTRATALAKELATAPHDSDDILNHGIETVTWLEQHGEPNLAAQLLEEVRTVWMLQFVSQKGTLPPQSLWGSTDPGKLIALGKDAARAGKHDQAFRFFGTASELLSFLALKATEHRTATLEEENAKDAAVAATQGESAMRAVQGAATLPRLFARSSQYSELRSIYDAMREIYGFYSVLEREALAAGDAKRATDARTKGLELHKEIKDKYSWGETQKPGSISQSVLDPVEVAEVSLTGTRKGPGLTLHGANDAETVLTQLPGLPSPKEVGNNVQVQNLGALQSALMAQTELQAEIWRQPEIRKAFGNEPIDLTDTKKRQRVWQIMYGVYRNAGSGALGSLMALVQRYLGAFTLHTTYNVRDWGASYLDSKMPTDLAGRVEMDCGVYALTVAWDVYETVKHADSKLDVSFQLVTMLEHVTLVITDKSTGEFYVVNNDHISPPTKGDPLELVGPQYGAIRGLPYTVGPAMPMDLGSTKDAEKRFRDDAWIRYLASVDWGLGLEIPPEVRKLEKTNPAAYDQAILAIQKVRYETFYKDQEIFDKGATELDSLVDGLAPVAANAAKLASALDPVVNKATALMSRFVLLGTNPGVVAGSTKSQALLPKQSSYLFTMESGHTVHPLARVGKAILHLKALGGTPTPKQNALLTFCQTVPQFQQQLSQYQATDPF